MNDKLKMLFLDNSEIDEAAEALCRQSPAYLEARREFYAAAHEVAKLIGHDRYDYFEQCFGLYMSRSNDLYYLFGLGLRQEVISALQAEMT